MDIDERDPLIYSESIYGGKFLPPAENIEVCTPLHYIKIAQESGRILVIWIWTWWKG